ncbi:MAG: hypothetical protein M1294_16540 [Firmicutes bacterium]|nr:hypothetical protein [Bacillota bacterium]
MADRNFTGTAGVKFNMMVLRVAFLIALLLGLGSMLHIFRFTIVTLDLHIAAGVIVAVVIWFLAISLGRRKLKGTGSLWTAAILMLIGTQRHRCLMDRCHPHAYRRYCGSSFLDT